MKLFISLTLLFVLIFCTFILPNAFTQERLVEALFYRKLDKDIVQCQLCPRRCIIPSGKRGFCGVRENQKGILYTMVYGRAVAVHIDPIEKKPLFLSLIHI